MNVLSTAGWSSAPAQSDVPLPGYLGIVIAPELISSKFGPLAVRSEQDCEQAPNLTAVVGALKPQDAVSNDATREKHNFGFAKRESVSRS